MTFQVSIHSSEAEFDPLISPVEGAVLAALAAENAPDGAEVAVVLTTDEEIARYHERFLGIPGPTDVLSWPAGEQTGETGRDFLGDIMVSCETAREQAATEGHSWSREVCVLAVHGALHLLGWDDATPEQAASMQERVDAIVNSISKSTESDAVSMQGRPGAS